MVQTFEVRFPTRSVLFQTDRYRHRGELARGIRRRDVLPVQELGPGSSKRKTWINLGLVEQVL